MTVKPAVSPNEQLEESEPGREKELPVSDEISLLVAVNAILRSIVWISIAAISFGAIVACVTFLRPRAYATSGAFVPQTHSAQSSFSGIAAQLGVDMANADISQSPAFYADLLNSRALLREVVLSRFPGSGEQGGRLATLVELYGVTAPTTDQQIERAIRELQRALSINTSSKTGVISFTVSAPTPNLARALGGRLLEAVSQFNIATRQTRAAAERRFTEQRLAEVQAELRAAEDRQLEFLRSNRSINDDPSLRIQQDRLAREVQLRQDLYTTVAQSYEQAKIDQVRDTPMITIIEQAGQSVLPVPRNTLFRGVLGFVIAGVIASMIAIVRELTSGRPLDSASAGAELRTLSHRLPLRMRRQYSGL